MLNARPVAPSCAGQRQDRVDRVVDVEEAARLAAVAVHGHVLADDRLAHEPRHDHPVDALLARADRVEQADHGRVGAVLAVVAVGERLAVGLGDRVGPPALERRADDRSESSCSAPSEFLPYTSEVDANSTRVPCRAALDITTSLPWTIRRSVSSGWRRPA